MLICDWSSAVCSAVRLFVAPARLRTRGGDGSGCANSLRTSSFQRSTLVRTKRRASSIGIPCSDDALSNLSIAIGLKLKGGRRSPSRSEEHTSELQSLMRISYAVFCLKKKKQTKRKQLTKACFQVNITT